MSVNGDILSLKYDGFGVTFQRIGFISIISIVSFVHAHCSLYTFSMGKTLSILAETESQWFTGSQNAFTK